MGGDHPGGGADMLWARNVVVSTLESLLTLVSRSLALYMAFFVLALGITHIKGYAKYPVLDKIVKVEHRVSGPATRLIKKNLPTKFDGVDISSWLFVFGLFLAWFLVQMEMGRLEDQGLLIARGRRKKSEEKRIALERQQRLLAQKQALEAAARAHKIDDAERAAQRQALMEAQAESARLRAAAAERHEQTESGRDVVQPKRSTESKPDLPTPKNADLPPPPPLINKPAEKKTKTPSVIKRISIPTPLPVKLAGNKREELLELMAKAKRSLEEQKKDLSFLAIDVVDSTGMKVGEDPAIAGRDFTQYRKLVEKAIEDNNGLKASWTPDGVMICFGSVEGAVNAAKQVINDLIPFNASVKAMQRDFQVRCGINAGRVLFDDTVPMEEMTDRTIDIAGHMQKYAAPNTIFIGKQVIEGMRGNDEFRPHSEQVDGVDVLVWGSPAGEADKLAA
jgi:class 3 adenylate cyclase/uncharacterized protein YggT (Ycf19 family)